VQIPVDDRHPRTLSKAAPVEQGFAAVPGVRNTGLVAYAVTVTVARFQGSSREHTASDLRCYRTCVIDGLLEHSPAEHVRRPAMLGLLGLRIFEATGADIADSARNTVTGCCACAARAPRSSWSRCRQLPGGLSTGPQELVPAARSCLTVAARGWTAMRLPGACGGSPALQEYSQPGLTRTCCATRSSRPCVPPLRARQNLDRHPNYILAAFMASGT
jgi:hypothetical protein